MTSLDLFGEVPKAPRKGTKPNGYAWKPGTGPTGKKCGDCKHCFRKTYTSKPYFKCLLTRASWGKTRKTDILSRSPACKYWEVIAP